MHGALDEDTPSFPRGTVDVIELEGHLVISMGYAGAEVLVCRAVLRRAEHNVSLMHLVVNRKYRRAEPPGKGNPADAARCDQPQALALIQLLERGCRTVGVLPRELIESSLGVSDTIDPVHDR
jgi:hypothetical protein